MRQIILSQLYFWANCRREGSMIPPRRRSTRCRVDSEKEINITGGPGISRPPPPLQAHSEPSNGTFLDVVVGERAAILQLLPRKDQALLVGGDPCGENR